MGADLDKAVDLLEEVSYGVDYAVVGPRDNRVHETRTQQFPFYTICHLERDFGDGVWRGASAVLIAPRLVLTAGHCLYSHLLRRAPVRIRVTPGRAGRDERPFGSLLARESYLPARYLAGPNTTGAAWRDFDYGVVVLPAAFQGIDQFMRLSTLGETGPSRLRPPTLVTIAGYPGDRPTGSLWRHTERLRMMTARRLFYTVDTCPGHSGSPIWSREGDLRHIIGVHTSGPIDETGRAYGCSKGAIFAPAGMMNSGIRITTEIHSALRDPRGTQGMCRLRAG